MQIIKVRFLKEDKPTGKCYTYFSPVEVKPGDVVQVNGSAKGVVVETDVPEWEIEPYREKIKTVVGLVEKKPDETFESETATLTQEKYSAEKKREFFNILRGFAVASYLAQEVKTEMLEFISYLEEVTSHE